MTLGSLRRSIADASVRLARWLGAPAIEAADAAEVAHLKKLFDRSSKAARIGVWECALPSETLSWTDMVYNLFELPVGCDLKRQSILSMYVEPSREELTRIRSRAIAERGGFSLDAEIVTALGNRRWIRITATVECENDVPIRIFGMKQDITSEKFMIDQIRRMAETDLLSGLANRNQFEKRFADACTHPSPGLQPVLVLIDMDGFKLVNDTFGHQSGDECLRETSRRLVEIMDQAEVVARIGGDEFAILAHCATSEEVSQLGKRIIAALAQCYSKEDKHVHVSASIGAVFGISGYLPKDVFATADAALYTAKREGGGRVLTKSMDTREARTPNLELEVAHHRSAS